jgi:methyl-accepting chemotaxis protein
MIQKITTMGLKGKLFCLVGLAIFLAVAIVSNGVFYYLQIEVANSLKEDVNKITQQVLEARVTEKVFLQFYTAEAKKEFDKDVQGVDVGLKNLQGKNVEVGWMTQLTSIGDQFQQYRKLFNEFVATHTQHDSLKQEMNKPLRAADEKLNEVIQNLDTKQQALQMDGDDISKDEYQMFNIARDCKIIFLRLQSIQQQFLASGDEKCVQDFKKTATGAAANLTALLQVATALKNKTFIENAKQVDGLLKKFMNSLKESQDLFAKEGKLVTSLNEAGKKIIEATEAFLLQVEQFSQNKRKAAFTAIAVILVTGLGLSVVLGVFLSLSITRPIHRIINGLSEGADQVSSASAEVSSASQSQAQGSSQQAASLEETSSSLEEMTSMTRSNADNANQASSLMTDTSRIVEHADGAMGELTVAMQEISSASDETAKIIKTIDAIAFQTNLLALNAAVEAARAGEAGAGFAVVANEVRNLAMRAAEAAQNTSNLIETTVNRVKGGSALVSKTAESFSQVTTSISKVKELVTEIAAASHEQAQGVEQINKAVSEMDQVVQQNAANAEESASASEELSAQSQQMQAMIEELAAVVGKEGKKSEIHSLIGKIKMPRKRNDKRKLAAHPVETKMLQHPSRASQQPIQQHRKAKEITPEEIIPLDDKDFRNF